MWVRAAAHAEGDGSLRGETLIAPTTVSKILTFNAVYSITLLTLANKQSPLPPHDDASRLAPPLQ